MKDELDELNDVLPEREDMDVDDENEEEED